MVRAKSGLLLIHPLFLLFCLLMLSCEEHPDANLHSSYRFMSPDYQSVKLEATADTLHFMLNDSTYNAVKSFNYFLQGNVEYFSIYDRRSESINIYDFTSFRHIKRLSLKLWFENRKLHNTTVYIKNMDSIYINNGMRLYMADSAGAITELYDFEDLPYNARASFDNATPPVFVKNGMYVKARCNLDEGSLKDLRKWKTLYYLNFDTHAVELQYNLPDTYRQHLYGNKYLDYSYCVNDKGTFVFSFPADTNVYETDLLSYNIAYFGKSGYFPDGISPVAREDISTGEGIQKTYLLRNNYGAIYYDRWNKRYLRVVKSKISEQDYAAKNWRKPQSIMIFNERFKVIGEANIDAGISLSSIFFTKAGEMYARAKTKDEYAVHFIRMAYIGKDTPLHKLTKNESQ